MSFSLKKVEELAPDQASLNAASKLTNSGTWPLLARDGDARLLWGECQGSGSNPYRLSVDMTDLGYRCSCPSRKFPCKHVLALLWLYAETAERFTEETVPDWVQDWLKRRRPKSDAAAEPASDAKTGKASLGAARKQDEETPEKSEKDKARAAAQRERQRKKREESILAGLDELERWIADQLDRGLAAFAQNAVHQCRLAAQRLVDAKASGIASLLDQLPSELFALPEDRRHDFLIERLGGFYLLCQAYRRQDQLPEDLRQDVRRMTGWQTRRDDLLADASATRVSGHWVVVATRSEVQADNLRRIETWLWRKESEEAEAEDATPEFALLMDFLPVAASGPAAPFTTGEVIAAEMAFYPSAAPLRALIAERKEKAAAEAWPRPRRPLPAALAHYHDVATRHPWLSEWPVAATGSQVLSDGQRGLTLADRGGDLLLPLDPDQRDELVTLVGLQDLAVVGLWNGHRLSLLTADTPIGRWQQI